MKVELSARGSRTPNTTARPRIWFSSVTRWPTSFLRAMISDRTANGPWTLRGTGYSAEGAISIEANGWTYGVPMDVAWTDETGLFHERYRPSCLPASGAIVSVTFMAVAAELGGVGIRPVIWVDCRGAVVEPPPNP